MSGDCGHGWAYHKNGASSLCSKCVDEYDRLKAEIAVLKKIDSPHPEVVQLIADLEKKAAAALEYA